MTRQNAVIERLAERIASSLSLEGALLIGSFARGDGDEVSDVDVIVVVPEGGFAEAWASRGSLEGGEAVAAWDDVDPEHDEIGGHKWLTVDLVLVECLLATPSSGVRLSEPFALLTGDPGLPDKLMRREPFTRAELDEYAADRVDAGRTHAIEVAYSEFARTVRSVREQC